MCAPRSAGTGAFPPVLLPGACPGRPRRARHPLRSWDWFLCGCDRILVSLTHTVSQSEGSCTDAEAQVCGLLHLINKYFINLRNNQEFYYIYLDSILQIS